MIFGISILGTRCKSSQQVTHVAFAVETFNRDEALGIAHRIAPEVFPKERGWDSHSVSVSDGKMFDPSKAYSEQYTHVK